MLFAHAGMGLVAKKILPDFPTPVFIGAAYLPDILAAPFALLPMLKINHVVWTHGLFMNSLWASLSFLITLIISRNIKLSITMGLLVFSHWILDFLSWPLIFMDAPLPPLFDSAVNVGLGTYSTYKGAVIGEIIGLLFVFLMVYLLKRSPVKSVKKAKR